MEVPFIISADAILKPRTGGLSLLNFTEELTFEDQKKLRADPAKVKQAVEELKKAGFSVVSVNKITIGIMAPTYLFEELFQVKIIKTGQGFTVEGSPQFGLIAVAQSNLAELLEGITIHQPDSQFLGAEPPEKNDICRLYPEDIPNELGVAPEVFTELKKFLKKPLGKKIKRKIRIGILDSGFHEHGYFKSKGYLSDSRKIEVVFNKQAVYKYYDLYKTGLSTLSALEQKCRDVIDKLDKLIQAKALKGSDITQNPDLIQLKKTPDLDSNVKKLLKEIKAIWDLKYFTTTTLPYEQRQYQRSIKEPDTLLRKEDDPESGHGTKVLANLFPLLELIDHSNVEIIVIKKPDAYIAGYTASEVFELALQQKLDIISCSYGTAQSWQTNQLPSAQYPYFANILTAKMDGSIVIFSSGNADKELENKKSFEAQLRSVISVGGAYKNKAGVITASDFAHGYIADTGRTFPIFVGFAGLKIQVARKRTVDISGCRISMISKMPGIAQAAPPLLLLRLPPYAL